MARYSQGFQERAVQMMMPPNARSVAEISRETGVSEQTLYNWRNRVRSQGVAVPADPKNPEQWSGESKLAVVIETAALNEEELGAYCRRKGLYVEQIQRWRELACAGASGGDSPLSKQERQSLQQERHKNRKLEKELQRKEKALAEAAALLVLQKKARAIWGDAEDD